MNLRVRKSNMNSGDTIQAAISNRLPHLIAPSISYNAFISVLTPAMLEFVSNTAALSFIESFHTFISLYRHLLDVQSTIFSNANTNIDSILGFTQLCVAAEHRLLSSYLPMTSPDPRDMLYTAAHTTLLLYSSLIFRNFKANSTTFISLRARLGRTLASLNANDGYTTLDHSEQKMLLWMLWIGGLTSSNRQLYISQIPRVLMDLGVHSWPDLKCILSDFLWTSRLEGPECWKMCSRLGISTELSP